MRFEDIKAQDAALGIIRRAVSGDKVPHAYLFSGPAGVGKFIAARALAMTLNCSEGGVDACGTCLSCRKILREIHPDVFTITLRDKKKRIPIESIRELERRLIARPHEGRAKVVIIDPADTMTEPAANALLKTLEEPRKEAFIVLVSSRASSLLPTVRSRCQQIRFKPLPESTVEDLLKLGGVDPEEASVVAALSDGSMEQASAYLSEDLESRIVAAFQLVKSALASTPAEGLDVAASVARRRDEALGLLDLVTIMLSEILWIKTHPKEAEGRVLTSKFGDGLFELANGLTTRKLTRFVMETHMAGQSIKNNNMNPQLALEGMLMSMRGRVDYDQAGIGFGV